MAERPTRVPCEYRGFRILHFPQQKLLEARPVDATVPMPAGKTRLATRLNPAAADSWTPEEEQLRVELEAKLRDTCDLIDDWLDSRPSEPAPAPEAVQQLVARTQAVLADAGTPSSALHQLADEAQAAMAGLVDDETEAAVAGLRDSLRAEARRRAAAEAKQGQLAAARANGNAAAERGAPDDPEDLPPDMAAAWSDGWAAWHAAVARDEELGRIRKAGKTAALRGIGCTGWMGLYPVGEAEDAWVAGWREGDAEVRAQAEPYGDTPPGESDRPAGWTPPQATVAAPIAEAFGLGGMPGVQVVPEATVLEAENAQRAAEGRRPMLTEATWDDFGSAGLFWWVNRALHLFGWALVRECDSDGPDAKVLRVYPARCRFRGFSTDVEEDGFKRLSRHLRDNWDRLVAEAEE